MPSDSATVLSVLAVAACSFLYLLILRRQILDSTRPELFVTDWGRARGMHGDASFDNIHFATFKNVGRGPALRVYAYLVNTPRAIASAVQVPAIAVNEAIGVDGEITIWQHAGQPTGAVGIRLIILCWDLRGFRHKTTYSLLVNAETDAVTDQIAPGVAVLGRTTTSRSQRALRLQARLKSARKLPTRYFGMGLKGAPAA
jgi:hypothetical protein